MGNSNENKAGFSQHGEQTEISGPGVSVKSTVTGNSGSTFGYASYSGTSMATPHVAGVAGLLRMYFPNCKAFQIRNAMVVTAKDTGAAGCDNNYGFGIVQAKAAFEYLEANACDPNAAFKEPEGGCAEFSCSADSDCDDGDDSTLDTCNSGVCQHGCASDASCDDGNPCTVDTCTDGVCSNVQDCSNCGGVNSLLELTTDNYASETDWNIKNSSQEEKYSGTRSEYSEKNTLYTIDMCLDPDVYTFTITDSYGDGICCSYGNGGYVIKVVTTEVASGGDFGSIETKTFTVAGQPTAPNTAPVAPTPLPTPFTNPTPPPTTAPVAPTPLPTPDPNAPSTAPVTTPTAPTECEELRITLNTDAYGYETSFTLLNDKGVTRLEGGGYPSSTSIVEKACLFNGRYFFTIYDSHGDGMDGDGCTLTLGNEELKSGGDFAESDSLWFDVGPPQPTGAPTPPPVCIGVGGSCNPILGVNCCSGRCGNYVCV